MEKPCPSCGYCPCCGQRPSQQYPPYIGPFVGPQITWSSTNPPPTNTDA